MKKNQVKNKIIALGDVHGLNKWQEIIKQPFSKVIFLGDYFDSFEVPFEQQLENFKNILAFKYGSPDKVVLLLGNHDYQYLSYVGEHYSGYQADKKSKISSLLELAIEDGMLQACYSYKNWVFTHAGITKTWLRNSGGNIKTIEDSVNRIFLDYPRSFCFIEGKNHSNYGDDVTQSPFWVRPKSLLEDKIVGFKQVVGHTHQKHIQITDDIFFIDTLEPGNEYLIINNDKPEIGEYNEHKTIN
jgi:hypothetical protein